MRSSYSLLATLSLVVAIGCGTNQPPATIYVTVPQAIAKPTTEAAKPKSTGKVNLVEPVKIDPWEEAQAYFKKVKETETEKTEAKLKKMDKPSESRLGHFVRLCREKEGLISSGDYPSSIGQDLWSAGLTEFVESQAGWAINDKRFRNAMGKLNPNPSAKELINSAIRFSVTHIGIRETTLDLIEKGGDTRDNPDTHRAATAWTGK